MYVPVPFLYPKVDILKSFGDDKDQKYGLKMNLAHFTKNFERLVKNLKSFLMRNN